MLFRKRIYLDQAAGTSPNPSSPHTEGRAAKAMLENARTTIARLLEVQSDDVIFTSGATESNALAILGFVRKMKEQKNMRPHVLYLPSAHASTIENVRLLEREGTEIEALPITNGRIDITQTVPLLRQNTVLVAVEAVCGETGVVWNTRGLAQLLRTREKGSRALLHIDASQAPLTEKITRDHFGADLMSLDASKVSSARGIGALVVHRTIGLEPLSAGGGQERNVRPGTEAPVLAQAFARGLAECVARREAFQERAQFLRRTLITELRQAIPDVTLQEGRNQAPHILNIALPGRDTDYLVALLDEAGFAVSTRSACETDSLEGSRAVFALTGDRELARSTLRISWGREVSSRDMKRFSRALIRAVQFIDRR
jgi:cysteine desulfurase